MWILLACGFFGTYILIIITFFDILVNDGRGLRP